MASTYPLSNTAAHELAAAPAIKASVRPFWNRLFDALVEAQTRRAEREIARYLSTGPFTDAAERAAFDRYLKG